MIKTLKKITFVGVALALLVASFLLGSLICQPCANVSNKNTAPFAAANTLKDFTIDDVTLNFHDGKGNMVTGQSPYFTYDGNPKSFVFVDNANGTTLDSLNQAINASNLYNQVMIVDVGWGSDANTDAKLIGVEWQTGMTDVPANVTAGFDQYWVCAVILLDKDVYNKPTVNSTDEFAPTVATNADGDYEVRIVHKWGIMPREVILVVKDQKSNALGEAPDLRPATIVQIVDKKTNTHLSDVSLSDVIDLSEISTEIEDGKVKLNWTAQKVKPNYVIDSYKEGNYTVNISFEPWIPSIALGGAAIVFLIVFLALFGAIKKLKAN